MDSNLNKKSFHNDKQTIVKVRLNKKDHIAVNREKLIASSSYFQCILSSAFKDHESEFVEVNYRVNFETFKTTIQFVSNGKLDLNDENIFSAFELADYLQMDELKTMCLDQFSSSLDRENVQIKFNLLLLSMSIVVFYFTALFLHD